jgi:hypothetical protein
LEELEAGEIQAVYRENMETLDRGLRRLCGQEDPVTTDDHPQQPEQHEEEEEEDGGSWESGVEMSLMARLRMALEQLPFATSVEDVGQPPEEEPAGVTEVVEEAEELETNVGEMGEAEESRRRDELVMEMELEMAPKSPEEVSVREEVKTGLEMVRGEVVAVEGEAPMGIFLTERLEPAMESPREWRLEPLSRTIAPKEREKKSGWSFEERQELRRQVLMTARERKRVAAILTGRESSDEE